MSEISPIVAIFPKHAQAEAAVRKLAASGIDPKHLSVIGKGHNTDEKVTGFYNSGDRMKLWGERGAFWGGISGLLFGMIFLTVPVLGSFIVVGYLATIAISAVEGAAAFGGLSILGRRCTAAVSQKIPCWPTRPRLAPTIFW
jgi:hypothetical protein